MAGKANKEIWLLLAGLPLALAILGFGGYFGLTHPTYSIPSESGEPNILKGDLIMARGSKFVCGAIQPERGDIVVFQHKAFTYFKRLVGLPGERIQFRNGVLLINGRPAPQTAESQTTLDFGGVSTKADIVRETLPNGRNYLIALADRTGAMENTPEFTVPAGQYFMAGDSRDNSLDSRFGEDVDGIGLAPAASLCGVAERVLSSPDRTHVWKAL